MKRAGPLGGAALTLGMVTIALTAAACSSAQPTVLGAVESVLDAGPQKDSADYVVPDSTEATTVADAVADAAAGREPTPPPGYIVNSQDGLIVLSERADGDAVRGWGIYAVRPGTASTVIVEVPHPRSDRYTEDIGTAVFESVAARALLVAGAHRTASDGAADVAHQSSSVFATVDSKIVGPGSVVLQLHGFTSALHDVGADAVVSSTGATPGPVVDRVAAALRGRGISACVYDGTTCQGLGGTRNVEGGHARTVGAAFVHLEASDVVRTDPGRRQDLVDALTEALRPQ